MPISIRPISPSELEALTPAFVDVMTGVIDGGASLGFLAPIAPDEARTYWLSLIPEVEAESRVVLAAFNGDHVVGSVQLKHAPWPNARHRAEVQKLFVANSVRRQGLGRSLMLALHDAARDRGRSLMLLYTRRIGPTVAFYKGLGYKEIGVIPGYALTPTGERVDDVALYQELSV